MPEEDYHHHVDTNTGAGVHIVSARQDPVTGKKGAINDSERPFLRESWRSAMWGFLWVLCFKIAPNGEHSCTRQSLMECSQLLDNEQSSVLLSNPAKYLLFSC